MVRFELGEVRSALGSPSSSSASVAPTEGTGARPQIGRSRGWYSRGYVPHLDAQGVLQSVTFRLADSLPQEKLRQLELDLKELSEDEHYRVRRMQIESWLDSGMGCCALQHPAIAETLENALMHFDGERYRLICWAIMPNHVHVVLEPLADLGRIVQSWKSFVARRAMETKDRLALTIPGPRFWMRDYWDRYIRNEAHLRAVVEYVHQNPVKAGLVELSHEWRWSSAWRLGERTSRMTEGRRTGL